MIADIEGEGLAYAFEPEEHLVGAFKNRRTAMAAMAARDDHEREAGR